MSRTLHIALSAYGVGGPGQHGLWKDKRVPKNASIDIDWYIDQAKKAEAAKLDALFIVDSQFINDTYPPHYLNRLEPLTLLSAVATHTKHLGLIATLTTTYNSPFNLARRFASLDHISRGRAGWNVVTSFDVNASKNFGFDEHLDYPTRYGRALEFVKVVQGLWDSYEDDAFPADVERDVFIDPSKLHALDHKGKHFSVAGPLNLSRSRQGQPVIFQSGVSEDGRNLAAHIAEGIYSPPAPLEEKQAYHADIKERARKLGRDPDHVVILIGARQPIVADSQDKALEQARDELRVGQRVRSQARRVRPRLRRLRLQPARPRRAVPRRGPPGAGRGGADLVSRATEQHHLRQVVESTSSTSPAVRRRSGDSRRRAPALV